MSKTFMRGKCRYCPKHVSTAGFAYYQHIKGHYNRTFGKVTRYISAAAIYETLSRHKKDGFEVL